MPPISAVLDADVLVPAVLRDTLLRVSARGLYRARWSTTILAEVEHTLVHRLSVQAERVQSLLSEMRISFPQAEVAGYEPYINAMANDPKDRHVVAAAVVAGAQVIVTRNVRHFPAAALEPFQINAQQPDDFLAALCDVDVEMMAQVIEQQAAALVSPPLTAEDILGRLNRFAPTFVERIRAAR